MQAHVKFATQLAKLLDSEFRLLGIRFGLDPLIGLIPAVGDAIALALSVYIIWIAVALKLPREIIGQMLVNVGIDFLLGLIPVIGDIGDVIYRANSRNAALLRQYANAQEQ